jgi:hypothetical protein
MESACIVSTLRLWFTASKVSRLAMAAVHPGSKKMATGERSRLLDFVEGARSRRYAQNAAAAARCGGRQEVEAVLGPDRRPDEGR